MIRKSGYRFSEKIMFHHKLERDDGSKKSHHALGCGPLRLRSHRILARELWCGQLLGSLVVHVEPRLPSPCALEPVAHVDAEPAEAFGLELDDVAVLEGAQAAVVGSGRHHVAGLEGVNGAHPFDAARD